MKTKKFLCHYFYDGAEWALTLDAYNRNDAESRLARLGNLKLDGEITLVAPASLGPFAKAIGWVRNQFVR